MRAVLRELIDLLALERIEQNLFRGRSQDLGWGRVFGGQVLGQALSAAGQTVEGDRHVHSLHSYFLRPGDAKRPVVYHVDPIRDGRSFTTRRVVAVQGGKAIFNLSASFQGLEDGFEHQSDAPDAAGPDGLKSEREWQQELMGKVPDAVLAGIPEPIKARARAERPIEIRPVPPYDPLHRKPQPPRRMVWYRASDPLPDDPALHRYLLAYASDFHFLTTSLQPHAVSWMTPGLQIASLDHSMWFHRPFRLDDWLLHVVDSPTASGARGLVRGHLFDRSGVLVASTAQEGLIRMWSTPAGA